MLKETLGAGVAYLHEGVEPGDRRVVQQLLECGAIQLCVVAAELAWPLAAHLHTVIVADTCTLVYPCSFNSPVMDVRNFKPCLSTINIK